MDRGEVWNAVGYSYAACESEVVIQRSIQKKGKR